MELTGYGEPVFWKPRSISHIGPYVEDVLGTFLPQVCTPEGVYVTIKLTQYEIFKEAVKVKVLTVSVYRVGEV